MRPWRDLSIFVVAYAKPGVVDERIIVPGAGPACLVRAEEPVVVLVERVRNRLKVEQPDLSERGEARPPFAEISRFAFAETRSALTSGSDGTGAQATKVPSAATMTTAVKTRGTMLRLHMNGLLTGIPCTRTYRTSVHSKLHAIASTSSALGSRQMLQTHVLRRGRMKLRATLSPRERTSTLAAPPPRFGIAHAAFVHHADAPRSRRSHLAHRRLSCWRPMNRLQSVHHLPMQHQRT